MLNTLAYLPPRTCRNCGNSFIPTDMHATFDLLFVNELIVHAFKSRIVTNLSPIGDNPSLIGEGLSLQRQSEHTAIILV